MNYLHNDDSLLTDEERRLWAATPAAEADCMSWLAMAQVVVLALILCAAFGVFGA